MHKPGLGKSGTVWRFRMTRISRTAGQTGDAREFIAFENVSVGHGSATLRDAGLFKTSALF